LLCIIASNRCGIWQNKLVEESQRQSTDWRLPIKC
jgi:hypothetical protein